MAVNVKVPSVGESVQEGVIYKWHKANGDYVDMDEVLVELETDKATVEVVAESSGLLKQMKQEGDAVQVGDVIAEIDETANKPAGGAPVVEAKTVAPQASEVKAHPVTAPAQGADIQHDALSPAVQKLVVENKLDPSSIPASGRGGRLTKADVLQFMEQGGSKQTAKTGPSSIEAKNEIKPVVDGDRQERREPLSMMRRRIAERLVHAQQTAAILTTFNEVDMSAVMDLRKQYKESFKEKHGVGLGFMSFFVKAAVEALREYPAINGWIEGNEIVYHDYYDVGVAVSSDRGLVVPVVRNCDRMSMAEIELAIGGYAKKARDGKITMDDLTGGTFTISNGGVFGSLLSTPILNPPQSAILGMHKIEQRAVVVDGQVVVRPMMYLALSYDHRIVDGKGAVGFLVKIKEAIEDPTRLLLGV